MSLRRSKPNLVVPAANDVAAERPKSSYFHVAGLDRTLLCWDGGAPTTP
jgi:hypothetical protein